MTDIFKEYAIEVVKARGHKNITGKHKTTFEITRDTYLTPKGDCIIGVSADKALSHFSEKFKNIIRNDDSILIIILESGNYSDIVLAHGSKSLTYASDQKIIVRKSTYIDDATACIRSTKAAIDIDRRLINVLKNPNAELRAIFIALRLHKIDSIYEFIGSIIENFPQTNNIPYTS